METGIRPTSGHLIHGDTVTCTDDHPFLTEAGFAQLSRTNDPGVPRVAVLPLRLLLPARWQATAQNGREVLQLVLQGEREARLEGHPAEAHDWQALRSALTRRRLQELCAQGAFPLSVARATGGAAHWVQLDAYAGGEFLIVEVDWVPDSRSVAFQVQDREQTWLDLNLADAASGRLDGKDVLFLHSYSSVDLGPLLAAGDAREEGTADLSARGRWPRASRLGAPTA